MLKPVYATPTETRLLNCVFLGHVSGVDVWYDPSELYGYPYQLIYGDYPGGYRWATKDMKKLYNSGMSIFSDKTIEDLLAFVKIFSPSTSEADASS